MCIRDRNQGQCIRRVREECKIGDELIFGADLKVVTGLRPVSYTHLELNTAIHISLLDFNEKVMAGREMSRKEIFHHRESSCACLHTLLEHCNGA